MSQSKQPCELCNRVPGTPHPDSCPRSRRYTGALRAAAARASAPRPVWIHGPQVIRLADGTEKLTFNPGIPYVGPGKPWHAGGRPRDMEARTKEFTDHLERVARDLRGDLQRPVHGHTAEEKAAAEGRPVAEVPRLTNDVDLLGVACLEAGVPDPRATIALPVDGLPGTPEQTEAAFARADATIAALELGEPPFDIPPDVR